MVQLGARQDERGHQHRAGRVLRLTQSVRVELTQPLMQPSVALGWTTSNPSRHAPPAPPAVEGRTASHTPAAPWCAPDTHQPHRPPRGDHHGAARTPPGGQPRWHGASAPSPAAPTSTRPPANAPPAGPPGTGHAAPTATPTPPPATRHSASTSSHATRSALSAWPHRRQSPTTTHTNGGS